MDTSSRSPLTPDDGVSGEAGIDATLGVTALYQAHAVGLIRLAVVMLGDRAAAEDVVQDAAVLVGEEHQHVLAAIRALPDRQREALVLRFYLDMSEEETARAMGISRGTVKSATSRAVAALGRMLKEDA
jgi:DNA-directed RNA polymerase specialized sigma24 family protein